MPPTSRTELARDVFAAFAAGDRARIESLLAPSLRFHAPPDPDLDRAGYAGIIEAVRQVASERAGATYRSR